MKRPHYAWFVCAGGALSLSTVMGLGANVFSVFQPKIIEFNQFTNTQGSWIPTMRYLFILIALLTVNQLCARIGLRKVMTLGNILMGLSCLSFAFADSFFKYLFSAALVGIGYCYGGMVPLSLIISNWFQDRRGLALGLASAGSGVSTIFGSPIITRIIDAYGLKTAFLCEALLVFPSALVIWLLLRDDPAQLGLAPYTTQTAAAVSRPAQAAERINRPRAQYLLFFAGLLIGGPMGPCFSHLSVLYTSEGFNSDLVALLISLMGITICISKTLCGQIYDRFGARLGNWSVFGVLLVGLLLCCTAPTGNILLALLAIITFSFGLSLTAVSPAVWSQDLSSQERYPSTLRSFNLSYTVGMLLFGPIPGMLADRTGSYVPSYLLFTGFLVVAIVIVQGMYYVLGLGKRTRA